MIARSFKAALAYAKLGWRVHPCRPGEKVPLLDAWQKRATTDQTLIERWWGRTPDANVAVATGAASGIFVLDVDGPEGERSLAALEHRHGALPDAPIQWTGGGRAGWQAFLAWPEGRSIRNSAGRLGAKLDTRGDGGFVIVPPSVTTERYRWAAERSPWEIPPEPAPSWLVDLLDPPAAADPPRPRSWAADPAQPARGSAYAVKALRSELALVAVAGDGRRNDQLNSSAHALFRFVASGDLDRDIVERGLEDAAVHAGLIGREIAATIQSAARARGLVP